MLKLSPCRYLPGGILPLGKSLAVIAGKTFQDIAMGKPTIVGDTPANHELLTHSYTPGFARQ